MALSKALLVALLTGVSFAQTSVSNIDQAPAQAPLSCPEPVITPGCSGFCWKWLHDLGTNGSSCGNSSLTSSPSLDGESRRFDVSWTRFGGERFSINLGPSHLDSASSNFVYDVWFYVTDVSHLRSLEFDHNQVIANGKTVIFGTQCNFAAGFWQYTTRLLDAAHWNNSGIPCPIFSANTWHHLTLSFHRDGNGVVTYDSLISDGIAKAFTGAAGPSDFALNWLPLGAQVENFQVGGDDTVSSTTVYLDSFSLTGSLSGIPSAPTNLTGAVH